MEAGYWILFGNETEQQSAKSNTEQVPFSQNCDGVMDRKSTNDHIAMKTGLEA